MSIKTDLPLWGRDLLKLGSQIRNALREQAQNPEYDLTQVAKTEESDVIYQIDVVSEQVILDWFSEHWIDRPAVKLVMEGIESMGEVIFPKGSKTAEWVCIIDPIDGTRGLMYDKRAAWFIAGIAPYGTLEESATLADLALSVMVELPTSKAGFADQIAAVKGCGPDGLVCERVNLFDGSLTPFTPSPYSGTALAHGFASFCKFFPEGKALTAEAETAFFESLDETLYDGTPLIFDDQYVCTAGQFYEILMGHDRFIADLRPEVFSKLGINEILCCHPYDVGAWLILKEAGCMIETPDGKTLHAPLDTTSPVAWVAYANREMAEMLRPKLANIRKRFF